MKTSLQPLLLSLAKFKFLHWNCKGLKHKKDELLRYSTLYDTGVFILQETFLKPSDFLSCPSYNIVRSDRTSTAGGGLLVGLRHDIAFSYDPSIQIPSDDDQESLFLDLSFASFHLRLLNIYLPRGKFDHRLVNRVIGSSKYFLIAGDFNCHHPAFGSYKTTKSGTDLLDWCLRSQASFNPLSRATHFHRDNRLCVIDLHLLSSNRYTSFQSSVGTDLLGSDHFPVLIDLDSPPCHVCLHLLHPLDFVQRHFKSVHRLFRFPLY